MRILVIGSGGREHAIVWKLAQSVDKHEIIVAPGNAGIASLAECVDIRPEEIDRLIEFALDRAIELVVVGPEVPLAMGMTDRMRLHEIKVFGPTQAAAKLESSKIFAKEFCNRHSIPTAAFEICDSADTVQKSAAARKYNCVIKADGLAAGKGVFVCSSITDVTEAIHALFISQVFGDAANKVIVEDCLIGEEVSILALVDGESFIILESSQDHKAAWEGDKGPNTGGMGAYSPAPVITKKLRSVIEKNIIYPTVQGMKAEGNPFTGVLYAGLMIVSGVPWVLEYNVRFGDPETQPVLMRLKTDLTPLLLACSEGKLSDHRDLQWTAEPAVCVVLTSSGYPGSYKKGFVISGFEQFKDSVNTTVFHAGTKFDQQHRVISAGGRVLGV
ncbi:phosphoribosylamine--glycine ligase, partial [bacterium]|nr:phosphoribosylamine--glycine ligase [bacterium]